VLILLISYYLTSRPLLSTVFEKTGEVWMRGVDRNFKFVVKNQNYVLAMAMRFIRWKSKDNIVTSVLYVST